LIANVDGVMNAVLVKGDAVGSTLYYGAGAGSLPTASAVVADVIDIARALTADPDSRVPHLAFQPDELSDLPVLGMDQVETAFYLRLSVDDKPGVLAQVTGILGESGISIEAVKQKEPRDGETVVPLVMLTHRVLEGDMNHALTAIEAMDTVRIVSRIRVEYLD
jgi:homoserine dehydrogenase